MLSCVVVLAGGSSRRLGRDKIVEDVAGVTVLDRLVGGLAGALPGVPVVVVGPPRDTERQVTWLSEDPPGGGPVAGLARALDELPDDALLAVLAGDQPFAAAAVAGLAAALDQPGLTGPDVEAVLAVDDDGREQPLLGVYRAGPLRAAIGGERSGRSVRSVVALLRVVRVAVPAGTTLDVDTADDLRRAREAAAGQPEPPSAL